MFKKVFNIIGAGLWCALLTISCASEGPKKPAFEQGELEKAKSFYTAFVEHQARTQGAMGLVVLVVDRDGILYNQGFGSQNPEKNIKFSTETISNVGSVSKLFTCLAVLTLVDKGLIDLDAPITKYLPEFKIRDRGQNVSRITARNLLTHHAGIINDILNNFGTNDPESHLQNSFRSVPALLGQTYMAEEPGALMSYSNLGYSLLGCIVERVSNERFESYVENKVLKPLGMYDSSFETQVSKVDRIAKGRAGNNELVDISRIRDIPAGSLTTTSSDMAKFLSFALNHGKVGQTRIISEKIFDEMWTRQNTNAELDFDFSIGLTWWLTKYDSLPSETLFGHGGDLDSFHAMLEVDDKRGIGIFVMTNALNGNSFSLDQIVFEGIRTFVKVQDGIDLAPPATKANVEVDFDETLAGTYATQMGMMQLDVQGKTARVDFLGNTLEGVQY